MSETDTDTDTTTAPKAQAPTTRQLPPEPDVKPDPPEAKAEPVDYFATYDSLKAGETLQVLKALGVTEAELSRTGTPQLVAVVWKHQRTTLGASKISDLLELTEKELLAALNLSSAEYVKQVTAYIESGSKS